MPVIVSVIIPNFNHSTFLRERIDSVLEQTYQDFEVILLDDLSSDNSLEIFNLYKDHPKVSQIFTNKRNSGSPFGMWQKGFELAKGDYIWIAESDDWSDLTLLERLVPKLKQEDVVVSHCRSNNFYMDSGITKINSWHNSSEAMSWDIDFIESGFTLLKKFGKFKCPVINVSSAVVRKNILQKIEVPVDYKYCGDWWFWAQIYSQGDVAFTAEPLNYIRVHDASATSKKSSKTILKVKENIKVIKDICELIGEPLTYHYRYNWLIDFWVKDVISNRSFWFLESLLPKVPRSFLAAYYKTLFRSLIRRH